MPYQGGSAMDPNGTWRTDGIDQIQMGNRQHALAMRQMGQSQSHDDLMAQLAMRQLQSGDNRFNAELADRQAGRAQGRQDNMNQFAAMADLTKAGWGHDDARHSSDLEAQTALARIMKEPNSLEAEKYHNERDLQGKMLAYLGIGGDAAPAPAAAALASGGIDLGGGMSLPGFGHPGPMRPVEAPAAAAPAHGGPDVAKMQTVAALQALLHGGSVPNFGAQNAQNELTQLELGDRKRNSATEQAKQMLESGDIDGAKRIAAAAGIALPIAPIEDFVSSNPGMGSELGSLADNFAAKDVSTTGWDPTDDDIQNVIGERDRMVKMLVRRGYPQDAAMAEANRVITQKIGTRGNDLNAGWIQDLKKRMGGAQPYAAPAMREQTMDNFG